MASLWYNAIGHGRAEMADAIAHQVRTLGAYSTFDPFTNEPAETLGRGAAGRSPRRPTRACSSPLGLGGHRHGDEAGPHGPRAGRSAAAKADHQPHPRLPRRRLRRHQRARHRRRTRRTSARSSKKSCRCPPTTSRRSPRLMSQRGNEVAAFITEPVQGAGGVYPAPDGYLQSTAQVVRPARRLPDLRRGHHRLRPPRQLVRGASLRRHRPTSRRSPRAITSGYIPLGGVFVGLAPTAALESDPSSSSAMASPTRATRRRAPPR